MEVNGNQQANIVLSTYYFPLEIKHRAASQSLNDFQIHLEELSAPI